jgi:(1->4)-alpha-D-glucan 1-alpha-D-glucosylmutase
VCSPYSPSSRLFLNILYLDATAVPDFRESNEAQQVADADRFRALRSRAAGAALVEYGDVAALKLPVLEQLYASFLRKHLGGDGSEPSARGDAFRRFQRERGDALVRLGVFEALSERFAGRPDWRDWPEEFRTPDSDAVRRFADEREDRVEFFQYLQWECDRQLHAASAAAADADMGIGLYQDMAVGLDRAGAEAWANRHLLANGASIGAPPDDWNLKGQNWGLVPYDPRRLRHARYMPLREMFRALMAAGGALRIDHVMGLRRLFWIPDGRAPSEGAYVRYPLEDLLGIVALESWRQRCMVIGEDLGTVPAGFRETMQRERIYSYRLFYFARRKDGAIAAPDDYPPQSVASVSTHDLATLPGYWTGHDLAVRAALGLFPSAETERSAAESRREDRKRIVETLRQHGLLPSTEEPGAGEMPFELVLAVHGYLAQCGSRLMVVQLEDILNIVEQANMPGTTTEHPNWRRKVEPGLDALAADPRVDAVAAALRALRPGPAGKTRG